jgi:hypothetical protein
MALAMPWFRIHPGAARVFFGYGQNFRVVEYRQVTSVIQQGLSDSPRGIPDVGSNMHIVRILGNGRNSPDVPMNISAVAVFDHAAIQRTRTLMGSYLSLGMNARVNGRKEIDGVTESLFQEYQEPFQARRLFSPFDLDDAVLLDGQTDRFLEVRGDAYVT